MISRDPKAKKRVDDHSPDQADSRGSTGTESRQKLVVALLPVPEATGLERQKRDLAIRPQLLVDVPPIAVCCARNPIKKDG